MIRGNIADGNGGWGIYSALASVGTSTSTAAATAPAATSAAA